MFLYVEYVSKSSGKSNLQVKYTGRKKSVRRGEPLHCSPGGVSGGTVTFRRVHGRALVEDKGEKPLAFLCLEGKTYLCIVIKTYTYFLLKRKTFIDSFVPLSSKA